VSSRIARTEVLTLQHPVVTPRGPAAVTYSSRECVIVRLEDADGVVGWGETYTGPGLAAVASALGEQLHGEVPSQARKLLHHMLASGADTMAISAWSIALDDLRGRQLGLSVADLYGGRLRDSIRAYASSGGYQNDAGPETTWSDDVSSAIADGFTAVKIRIGRFAPRREAPLLENLRALTDADVELMVDANGAYSVPQAIEVGRVLEANGYRWFEEPLIRFRDGLSYPGYEHLSSLDIPIAAGEGLPNRGAFAQFVTRGAADIIQPDIAICGGIGEGVFIAEFAALHGKPTVPHAWGGAILLAATVQFASLIPEPSELPGLTSPLLEFDRFENRMRTEITRTPLALEDGHVRVPVTPGLGIEIDEDALRALSVRLTD